MGKLTFSVAVVLFIIGYLYNRFFKKSGLAGNLIVSFSVGMTFVYGAISVGMPFNKMAWYFGVIAALIDLGEEISADAMDMEGDRLIGSGSMAIRFGRQTAIRTAVTIFAIVVFLSFVPFVMKWFSYIYILPIGILIVSVAVPACKLLRSTGQEGRLYIRWIYLGATLGLVIFILMRLLKI